MKASNPGTTKADFKGKRLASAKGSTSELSIKLNSSQPLTFQDTGSAFMAVQQNKALGMVANTMTITKLVSQSKTVRQRAQDDRRTDASGADLHRHEEG